jgi:hypothetical protein
LEAVRRRRAIGLTLASAFLALFVHSLVYSGFFETPAMWGILALAGVVVAPPAPGQRYTLLDVLPATDGTGLAPRSRSRWHT